MSIFPSFPYNQALEVARQYHETRSADYDLFDALETGLSNLDHNQQLEFLHHSAEHLPPDLPSGRTDQFSETITQYFSWNNFTEEEYNQLIDSSINVQFRQFLEERLMSEGPFDLDTLMENFPTNLYRGIYRLTYQFIFEAELDDDLERDVGGAIANLTPQQLNQLVSYVAFNFPPASEEWAGDVWDTIFRDFDFTERTFNYERLAQVSKNKYLKRWFEEEARISSIRWRDRDYRECQEDVTPTGQNLVKDNPNLIFYDVGDLTFCFDYEDVEWMLENEISPWTRAELTPTFITYLRHTQRRDDYREFIRQHREVEEELEAQIDPIELKVQKIHDKYPYLPLQIINADEQDVLHFIDILKLLEQATGIGYNVEYIEGLQNLTHRQLLDRILQDVIDLGAENRWGSLVETYFNKKALNDPELRQPSWEELLQPLQVEEDEGDGELIDEILENIQQQEHQDLEYDRLKTKLNDMYTHIHEVEATQNIIDAFLIPITLEMSQKVSDKLKEENLITDEVSELLELPPINQRYVLAPLIEMMVNQIEDTNINRRIKNIVWNEREFDVEFYNILATNLDN